MLLTYAWTWLRNTSAFWCVGFFWRIVLCVLLWIKVSPLDSVHTPNVAFKVCHVQCHTVAMLRMKWQALFWFGFWHNSESTDNLCWNLLSLFDLWHLTIICRMDDAERGRCDSRCAWLYATNQPVVKLECYQLAVKLESYALWQTIVHILSWIILKFILNGDWITY